MKISISKNVLILSFSFFLIFFGFNGVQQHITVFFSEAGLMDIGFISLILIYVVFSLFSFVAIIFSLKHKLKYLMAFSSLGYSVFILSLLSHNIYYLFLSSVMLGIAAAFLWTSQTAFLIRSSEKSSYGLNSGFFLSVQRMGSALGVIFFSIFLARFLFTKTISIFLIFPLLGFATLLLLKEPNRRGIKKKINILRFLGKVKKGKTLLRLSSVYFSSDFVLGLIIGTIPFQIKEILGITWIGVLTSPFYIVPVLLSFPIGWLSDIMGRRKVIFLGYLFTILGFIFLLFAHNFIFLFIGIILLSLNNPFIAPASISLVGDAGSQENFEIISGFFLSVRSAGTITGLVLGILFPKTIIYIVSIIMMILVSYLSLPLLRIDKKELVRKVLYETE